MGVRSIFDSDLYIYGGGKRYQAGSSNNTFGNGNNFSTATTNVQEHYEATSTSYVVKSGDTLGGIARRHGISVEQLYQDNKDLIGSNPNMIYPGQELVIREQSVPAQASEKQLVATQPQTSQVPQQPAQTVQPVPQPTSQPQVIERSAQQQFFSANVGPAAPGNTSVGSAVEIPMAVHQNGLTKSFTKYTGFHWVYAQGEVFNQWVSAGSQSSNGLATLNGKYLVAVTKKFGQVGDNIDIILDDGQVIPAIIADTKNPGDSNYTEWGHALAGGNRCIDVIEWETVVNTRNEFSLGTWGNMRVNKIVNYNRQI